MSTLVKAWCSCGWHGEYDSEAYADYARRRHSCAAWERKRAKARHRLEIERAVDRAPKQCTHKIANHQHGTYIMYTLDFCRCAPCCKAKGRAEKQRMAKREAGIDAYVDARPATEHVRALMAAGFGWKRVAAAAGVPQAVVYPLLYGRPDRNGGKPRTKARRATVEAILAVPFPMLDDFAPRSLVPATGTLRRLRALQSLGWPVSQIAREAGVERQVLDAIARGNRSQVTAERARAVRDTYDRLWNAEPCQDTTPDRIAVSWARNRAAAAGWPMPLDLELIDVDDPDAPERGRSVVATVATPDERLDDWLDLVRGGERPDRAARRVGYSPNSLDQTARRLGRQDVLRVLTGQVAA
jgi:transcriptional regulator with XRE-family HTH domain